MGLLTTLYQHNVACTAATDMFTAIGPTQAPSTFRIYICIVATTPTLTVQRTNSAGGGGTIAETISPVPLISGSSYIFDIPMAAGDTMTLRSSASGTVNTLILREIPQ